MKKNWTWIVFGIIVITTIFLRFYNLPGRMIWDGDSAEDASIAYHISHFGERLTMGRGSMGGETSIANSYLIFYFLAIISFIHSSAMSNAVFYAAVSVLMVIFIYILGKYFTNSKFALVIMVMVAYNWYFGFSSNYSFFSLLTSMMVGIVWLFLQSWYKKSWQMFCLFCLALLATLHVEYAVLSIMPILVIWGIINYFRISRGKNRGIKLIMILWPVLLIGLWLLVTSQNGGGVLAQFKIFNLVTENNFDIEDLWSNWIQILDSSARYFLSTKNIFLIITFWIMVYGGLGYWCLRDWKRKDKNFFNSIFLFSLIMGVFGAGWMGGAVVVERLYVLFYYPLWIMSFGYVMWRFLKVNAILKYMAAFVLGLYVILMTNILHKERGLFFEKTYKGGWEESEIVVKEILTDSQQNQIGNYKIVFYNKYTQFDNFGKTIFWYPIEKSLNQKKIELVQEPYGIYFREIGESKITYLVCYDYKTSGLWNKFESCEKLFQEKHVDKKYLVEKVMKGAKDDWSYKVFRLREIER